jgi:hypothetical protein
MSSALLEPPVREAHAYGITLEDALTRAFEGTAACPVCGGDLEHSLGQAECGNCGSLVA